jgi:hypothetical protein
VSLAEVVWNPQDHFPAVYDLLSEHDSYTNAPGITVIPAYAGIHYGRSSAR